MIFNYFIIYINFDIIFKVCIRYMGLRIIKYFWVDLFNLEEYIVLFLYFNFVNLEKLYCKLVLVY